MFNLRFIYHRFKKKKNNCCFIKQKSNTNIPWKFYLFLKIISRVSWIRNLELVLFSVYGSWGLESMSFFVIPHSWLCSFIPHQVLLKMGETKQTKNPGNLCVFDSEKCSKTYTSWREIPGLFAFSRRILILQNHCEYLKHHSSEKRNELIILWTEQYR